MSLKDLLTRKKPAKPSLSEGEMDDLFAKMQDSAMDIDQMRDKVMSYIWYNQMDKLHDLCEDQIIMTPIFFEKLIREIVPGNKWNDVLFLTARKMLEAYPDPVILIYSHSLEEKHSLVKHPDGGKEIMAPFVNFI